MERDRNGQIIAAYESTLCVGKYIIHSLMRLMTKKESKVKSNKWDLGDGDADFQNKVTNLGRD